MYTSNKVERPRVENVMKIEAAPAAAPGAAEAVRGKRHEHRGRAWGRASCHGGRAWKTYRKCRPDQGPQRPRVENVMNIKASSRAHAALRIQTKRCKWAHVFASMCVCAPRACVHVFMCSYVFRNRSCHQHEEGAGRAARQV